MPACSAASGLILWSLDGLLLSELTIMMWALWWWCRIICTEYSERGRIYCYDDIQALRASLGEHLIKTMSMLVKLKRPTDRPNCRQASDAAVNEEEALYLCMWLGKTMFKLKHMPLIRQHGDCRWKRTDQKKRCCVKWQSAVIKLPLFFLLSTFSRRGRIHPPSTTATTSTQHKGGLRVVEGFSGEANEVAPFYSTNDFRADH